MVMSTRSTPTFTYESQTNLWSLRKQLSMLTGFPLDDNEEEALIMSLSSETATERVASTTAQLEAFKKKKAKRTPKKGKEPETSNPEEALDHGASDAARTDHPGTESDVKSETGGEKSKGESSKKPAKGSKKPETDPSNPSDSSDSSDPSSGESSSDDDDNPSKRISAKDKNYVRGRTPRVESSKTSTKLFKMEPPTKYSGEKDSERTYDAVHLFLSQLSRYLRLATYIDMEKDIAEYLAAFLDGFAYRWFETLDKGGKPFVWKDFEHAFRGKFVPREYAQIALAKYIAIEQRCGVTSVAEYIVQKEYMENTLGSLISDQLKETTFRKGLDPWILGKINVFRDVEFEVYKKKAESVDRDAHERKVGPYREKAKGSVSTSGDSASKRSTSKSTGGGAAATAAAAAAEIVETIRSRIRIDPLPRSQG